MKRSLLCIAALLPLIAAAQVSDDFSDGNFTENPSWTGDDSCFEVNVSGQLHLKTTGTDTAILCTRNIMNLDTEWNFWVKLSFNTSANNFARVYLATDNPDLKGKLNGYYLQAGGSSDSVFLFRQVQEEHTPLLRLATSYTGNSVNTIRFRVLRDAEGKWTVYADNSGNSVYGEEGSITDNNITVSSWAGVYCRFTSSNSSKFYFDDFFIGPVRVDSIPPGIREVRITAENVVSVSFSEAVDKTEAEKISNYTVPGHGSPVEARLDSLSRSMVFLTFTAAFDQGRCDTLVIRKAVDIYGNKAENQEEVFCHYTTGTYDIVFTEIMADPSPQTGLPDAEYAELLNRSPYRISLKDWTFQSGQTIKTFPDMHMDPGEYLILSKGSLLGFYGRTIDLFTSSSTLPNEGAVLALRNEKGQVIHSVSYSMEWYGNTQKKNGGWSLEMADPGNPCGCAGNWLASEHILGGTPGDVNSVSHPFPDTVAPHVARVIVENDSLLRVVLSESADSASLPLADQWKTGEDLVFSGTVPFPPLYREIGLSFSKSLNPGRIYQLNIPGGIRDCSGNATLPGMTARFALPDTVEGSDLVINEFLPDPYPGGDRFVELFNRSGKALDLRHLVLLDPEPGSEGEEDPAEISGSGHMVFPGEYVVLAKDSEDIISRYHVPSPECIVIVSSIPGMTQNDSGSVILARKHDLEIIDRISYSSGMHFPLLSSPEGVSLERISSESPSANKSNWHSAAGSSGFATPGYRNSQSAIPGNGSGFVRLDPEIFSPDNDGRDDLVFIRFQPERPGFIANLAVYSSSGTLVKYLARNRMVPAECIFSWDGITEENRKAPVGIYIILAEVFHPDGETGRFRLPVVLAGPD